MPKLYVREFLNLPEHGSAFVLASAETRSGKHTRTGKDYLDAELTLCDCHRQITLDLSLYGPEEVANVRHKSALLRRTVNDLLDQVDAAIATMDGHA